MTIIIAYVMIRSGARTGPTEKHGRNEKHRPDREARGQNERTSDTMSASTAVSRRSRWRGALATVTVALVGLGAATVLGQQSASAAESSPVGWAGQNGGTTGGAGGSSVTVTNAAALDKALQSNARLTIRVSGMIKLSGMHHTTSNKSIVGLGARSGLDGGGIAVEGVSNVIIRNLTFVNASDDAITIDRHARNVWVDHNDLSSGSDGLVDVRIGSDFVTVSWNRLHHHDKTMLAGAADTNGDTDIGHLRVTYHHNFFDGTNQRNPRIRFGNPVHIYNNYYRATTSYGAASTCNAGVLVEKNYFDGVRTPTVTQTGVSPAGNLRLVDNHLAGGSGAPQSRNPNRVAAIPYGYTPHAAADVKSIVTAGAGVGKIGL